MARLLNLYQPGFTLAIGACTLAGQLMAATPVQDGISADTLTDNTSASQSGDEEQAYQRLVNLVKTKQFNQAWEEASAQLAFAGGDPLFDFLYGRTAVETGHYREAVFAFERVTLVSPELVRAQLELSRAYYLLGDYPKARKNFKRVLAQKPPEAVAKRVNWYLDQIEHHENKLSFQIHGFAALKVGSDSNINSAVAIDNFDVSQTPELYQIIVNAAQDEQGNIKCLKEGEDLPVADNTEGSDENLVASPACGNFSLNDSLVDISAGFQMTFPSSKTQFYNLSGSYALRNHASTDAYDSGTAGLSFSSTTKDGNLYDTWTLSYNNLTLNNEKIFDQLNYANEYQWLALRGHTFNAKANLGWRLMPSILPNEQGELEDITTNLFLLHTQLGWSGFFPNHPVIYNLLLDYSLENATEDLQATLNKSTLGITAAANWQINNLYALTGTISSLSSQYEEPGSMSINRDVARSDDLITVNLGLRRHTRYKVWLKGELLYAQNTSNTDFYNYDRTQVQLSVGYNF